MTDPATNHPPSMNEEPRGVERDDEEGLTTIGTPHHDRDGHDGMDDDETVATSERAELGDTAYGSAVE